MTCRFCTAGYERTADGMHHTELGFVGECLEMSDNSEWGPVMPLGYVTPEELRSFLDSGDPLTVNREKVASGQYDYSVPVYANAPQRFACPGCDTEFEDPNDPEGLCDECKAVKEDNYRKSLNDAIEASMTKDGMEWKNVKCPYCHGAGGQGGDWCVMCSANGKIQIRPQPQQQEPPTTDQEKRDE